jgi:hypothetical protein
MFYLEQKLRQLTGVQSVQRHRNTSTEGRWSIITTDQYLTPLRKTLADNLSQWVQQHCFESDHIIDPSLPEAGLAFKQTPADTESTGSFETYLSACVTIYSNITMEDFPELPPDTMDQMAQEWDLTIPNTDILPSPPTFPPSPDTYPEPTVSLSTHRRLQEAHDTLTQTVKVLQEQLHRLMAQSAQYSSHNPDQMNIQPSESTPAGANTSMDSAFSSMSNESN